MINILRAEGKPTTPEAGTGGGGGGGGGAAEGAAGQFSQVRDEEEEVPQNATAGTHRDGEGGGEGTGLLQPDDVINFASFISTARIPHGQIRSPPSTQSGQRQISSHT